MLHKDLHKEEAPKQIPIYHDPCCIDSQNGAPNLRKPLYGALLRSASFQVEARNQRPFLLDIVNMDVSINWGSFLSLSLQ